MKLPSRPLLRWHGGKWLLAPWIIEQFGPHRVYVEPFGGAASVLIRKPRAYAEYYGDLDDELVNLFSILRSADADRLVEQVRLTPFARAEFVKSYLTTKNELERARRMIVRSFMGFGSSAALGGASGFRATSNRSGTTPAHDWRNLPDTLPALIERLRGVVVEQRPAIELMADRDGPNTLHYVDPPYLPETRGRGNPYCTKHKYRHELTIDDHRELLEFLGTLKGAVVLSGYPSDLYDETLRGWLRIERASRADGARKRCEVLWLNARAAAARPSPDLMERAA